MGLGWLVGASEKGGVDGVEWMLEEEEEEEEEESAAWPAESPELLVRAYEGRKEGDDMLGIAFWGAEGFRRFRTGATRQRRGNFFEWFVRGKTRILPKFVYCAALV